jgi:predicted nucleotidyltransferase
MTPLARVTRILREGSLPFALIGAAAMAVHGIARSTLDLDLLTTDPAALQRRQWEPLESSGAVVAIRYGDVTDPLTGVVTITQGTQRPIDVIVGEASWQKKLVSEAVRCEVQGVRLPVVTVTGLILLKLYAGGPQDRWDIEQLLGAVPNQQNVEAQVTQRLEELPPAARELWATLGN